MQKSTAWSAMLHFLQCLKISIVTKNNFMIYLVLRIYVLVYASTELIPNSTFIKTVSVKSRKLKSIYFLMLWRFDLPLYMQQCGNCAFPQNFHTRKLSEITVFFVAQDAVWLHCISLTSLWFSQLKTLSVFFFKKSFQRFKCYGQSCSIQ